MHLSISDILNLAVSLQLFLLIAILLHRGGNNLSNRLLAFFFFAQAIVFLSIVWIHNFDILIQTYPYLGFIVQPFGLTWGPTMFLFVKSRIKSQFKLNKVHILHYAPAIIYFIYLLVTFHIKPIEVKRELLISNAYLSIHIRLTLFFFVLAQVFVYNVVAIYQLRVYELSKKSWTSQERYSINVTQFLLYGYFIACILHDIFSAIRLGKNDFQLNSVYNYLSLFGFSIYFVIVIYKLISSPENVLTGRKDKKTRNLILDSKQMNYILERAERHMLIQKPFLEFNYSLNQLANDLEIKPRELSQAINEIKSQNFYDFVNTYRIAEAKKLLIESIENKQTILEIIYASGFNSKTTFNTAFKKQTGLTPTEFKNKYKE